jgi:pimeloyl-ACP methyl ester carboxylesterase
LHRKLELTRLSDNNSCGEDNGVTAELMRDTVHFWLTKYDWHAEEAKLNNMPQFTTFVDADDFGDLEIHFVHSKTSARDTVIPLLFLHGWPGSFLEVQRLLPLLNHAGFDVVAPSLPGYGFSSYPTKAGFKHKHHARTLHKLMVRLGYDQYAVQGGDWGSDIARTMGRMFPTHIRALHQNMVSSSTVHHDFELISNTAHDGKA